MCLRLQRPTEPACRQQRVCVTLSTRLHRRRRPPTASAKGCPHRAALRPSMKRKRRAAHPTESVATSQPAPMPSSRWRWWRVMAMPVVQAGGRGGSGLRIRHIIGRCTEGSVPTLGKQLAATLTTTEKRSLQSEQTKMLQEKGKTMAKGKEKRKWTKVALEMESLTAREKLSTFPRQRNRPRNRSRLPYCAQPTASAYRTGHAIQPSSTRASHRPRPLTERVQGLPSAGSA